MKVWKLSAAEANRTLISESNDGSILDSFRGIPVKDIWRPVRLLTYKKGKNVTFPYLSAGVPIFTPRVKELVGEIIKDCVEFLPAIYDELDVTLVNVLIAPTIIDYEKSILKMTPFGSFYKFDRLDFILSEVTKHPIFKVKEQPSTPVFVTDVFRDLILEAKLKGFDFEEVWNSEVSIEERRITEQRYTEKVKEIESYKGHRLNWDEAVNLVNSGKAVISGIWKMQNDKNGNLLIAKLGENCEYQWFDLHFIPPVLLTALWHETDLSDI